MTEMLANISTILIFCTDIEERNCVNVTLGILFVSAWKFDAEFLLNFLKYQILVLSFHLL